MSRLSVGHGVCSCAVEGGRGVGVLQATVISAELITHRPAVLGIIIDFWSLMFEAAGS